MARHRLDARGLRCPWPALRLARLMREAASGDTIEMIVDDPKADGEVVALSRENGWPLTRSDQERGSLFILSR